MTAQHLSPSSLHTLVSGAHRDAWQDVIGGALTIPHRRLALALLDHEVRALAGDPNVGTLLTIGASLWSASQDEWSVTIRTPDGHQHHTWSYTDATALRDHLLGDAFQHRPTS